MGCFLACFGSSKHQKRRKRRNKILPRDKRHASQKPLQNTVPSEQDISEEPITPVSELRDKPEEQLSLSSRKRVTFDSNVKTYEPVSVHESKDFGVDSDKASEKEKDENSSKSSQSHSLSEDDSITSSTGSYPPNHRYQNCRDSDDEVEELDDENSDLDDEELEEYEDCDEDSDDDRIVGEEVWSESIPAASMESRTELESPMTVVPVAEREVKALGLIRKARDRSMYVHPVLNPVENLTQWKAVKSKGTPPLKSNKENCTEDQDAVPISFSSEPSYKEFKSKSKQSKNLNQEIAVDASLSNWLVSPEATPTKNNTSSTAVETITSEKSMSQGSNSAWSIEDRPILGALTVEELRQFSTASSPRKSPSRSPDEMPIIGTVGTYWNHTGQAKKTGSASSYKGITNTTSKYRRIRE